MRHKGRVISNTTVWNVVFLLTCVFAFIVVYVSSIIAQDFWFHAAIGADIERTHVLPQTIAFAFGPVKDNFFLVHSWLSSRWLYLGMSELGFHGMVMIKALLFALLFGLAAVWTYLESRVGFYALLALALVLIGFMGRYAFRPELFGFFFFMVHLGCMRLFSKFGQYRYVFVALGLFPLWVNVHPSFWVGFYTVAVFALHDVFSKTKSEVFRSTQSALLPWGCVFIAFVAASFINPYGLALHLHTLHAILFSKAIQTYALEWLPFFSHHYYGTVILLCNTMLFMVVGLLWWHKRRIMPLWGHLLCIPFYLLALSSQRFTAFLVLAVLLPLAHCYADSYHPLKARFVAQVGTLIVLSLLLFRAIEQTQTNAPLFDLSYRGHLSEKALGYIAQQHIKGPVWNHASFGAQILYFFTPSMEVFIDGRLDAYGDAHIRFYKYFLKQPWYKVQQFFLENGIHVAMFPPNEFGALKQRGVYNAFRKDGWCIVYHDPTVVMLSDNMVCEVV